MIANRLLRSSHAMLIVANLILIKNFNLISRSLCSMFMLRSHLILRPFQVVIDCVVNDPLVPLQDLKVMKHSLFTPMTK